MKKWPIEMKQFKGSNPPENGIELIGGQVIRNDIAFHTAFALARNLSHSSIFVDCNRFDNLRLWRSELFRRVIGNLQIPHRLCSARVT